MDCENGTDIVEFVLLGLSTQPEHQPLFFLIFLLMYLAGLLGNTMMIVLITLDSRLQTPMYFLLRSLSVVDMGFISVTVPQMLAHLISSSKTIPFYSCMAQFFFFYVFGVTDLLMVSVMALDRYVAICNPLHYVAVMNQKVCGNLVAGCWIVSTLHSMLHSGLLLRLSYQGNNHLSHFFCDHEPLLQLSCSDTSINETAIFFEGGLIILGPFVFIIVTYARIVAAVIKFSSSGRRKAFSTCGSHLTMVVLLYGAIIGVYFQPASSYSAQRGAVFAVMYTVITPMSNPYIYSLRNKDVKGALRHLLRKRVFSQ
ncbi:olfactory receptor 1B1-like isoform X2 [Hemicordylus capensis]|uniref:olfactory receptor 1B1-like isoform X2 n=1 Tax=Hemicordylus capensis TaxID=884348 RepID=UPI0023026172|nr:olfactory receptor 1B1-like isoform X2 [Hemicordylus capensis]